MFKNLAVSLLLGEVSSRLAMNTYECTNAGGCVKNEKTEFVMDSNYCGGNQSCTDGDYKEFGVSVTNDGDTLR